MQSLSKRCSAVARPTAFFRTAVAPLARALFKPASRSAAVTAHAEEPSMHSASGSAVASSVNKAPERYGAYSDEMSPDDLKASLLDSLYGTERGLAARSEVRAEINELISQLEAKSPTLSPTEALEKLNGDWKLLYTSNSELISVLSLSRLPLVTMGEVTQRIDTSSLTVENKVGITVPFSRTAFTTTASFEVRSPKRLQLKMEKGGIQTPQLLADLELPSSITILGQAVDLTMLKSALEPVNEGMREIFDQVNNLMSQTPELQVKVPSEQAQTWQLNTYVDGDTRISRGDGGSVFIYVKDVSLSEA